MPWRPTGSAEPARTSPSFGTAIVDGPEPKDPAKWEMMDRQYRQRVQSLQAVDEGVRSIVETLRKTGDAIGIPT